MRRRRRRQARRRGSTDVSKHHLHVAIPTKHPPPPPTDPPPPTGSSQLPCTNCMTPPTLPFLPSRCWCNCSPVFPFIIEFNEVFLHYLTKWPDLPMLVHVRMRAMCGRITVRTLTNYPPGVWIVSFIKKLLYLIWKLNVAHFNLFGRMVRNGGDMGGEEKNYHHNEADNSW